MTINYPPEKTAQPTGVASVPASAGAADGDLHSRWLATLKALARCKGKKYNLGALLRDCKADSITLEGETLVLCFTHRANMERMQEELDDPNGRRMVSEAVGKFFGESYTFKLTLKEIAGIAAPPDLPQ